MKLKKCTKWKARPAFKGYGGFPFTISASPNERVVHGFAKQDPLQDGAIISIDFGLIIYGFHSDSAVCSG
ncbi:MAG: M24 family metallopeptidase [Desulfuromusa sp.]|nr:M24 family metallopeptidase [Desulfuromusa sp.]